MSHNTTRVRFAPSPTGPLHIGGLRTALYNYLFAKKNKGTFILRIEDTDEARLVPGAKAYILKALEWCNIKIDEGVSVEGGKYGPYEQSKRKNVYEPFAKQLVDSGHAYFAFDTKQELENLKGSKASSYNYLTRMSMRNSLTLPAAHVKSLIEDNQPYVIRVKLPRNETFQITDAIRGIITVNTSSLDDKVLFKSNGMPTYHLANVVDDYLMKISHVIRGEEWLPSMPLHVLLYKYLGISKFTPIFAHLPLLLNPSGKGKLSKRDGDKLKIPVFPLEWRGQVRGEVFMGYKEQGYLPEAIVNMLALLGWNAGTNQEIFSLEELINNFSLERISKSGAKFNIKKMQWFNQQYLRLKPAEYFLPELNNQLEKHSVKIDDQSYLLKVIDLVKEKLTFRHELWENIFYFFIPPNKFTKVKDMNTHQLKVLQDFVQVLESQDTELTQEDFQSVFKDVCQRHEIDYRKVMKLFRISISGAPSGPPIFQVASLLTKPIVVSRLKLFVSTHKSASQNDE